MPEFSLQELRGKPIFTSDGLSVGTIVRFEIDSVLWKVRSIVANVADNAMEPLGLKKSIMRANEILVGKELVKSVGDVINLNVTMQMLRQQLSQPTSKKKVISED